MTSHSAEILSYLSYWHVTMAFSAGYRFSARFCLHWSSHNRYFLPHMPFFTRAATMGQERDHHQPPPYALPKPSGRTIRTRRRCGPEITGLRSTFSSSTNENAAVSIHPISTATAAISDKLNTANNSRCCSRQPSHDRPKFARGGTYGHTSIGK